LGGKPAALYAGIAAAIWIGLAVSLRALSALEDSRAAYARLDEAHLALEQAADEAKELADERDETIAALARRNVEYSAAQAMLGSLLELADDRSDGQLRARLEETAEELTEWLPQRDEDR
jgi:biopolymer transport protein ExbB/TolQ